MIEKISKTEFVEYSHNEEQIINDRFVYLYGIADVYRDRDDNRALALTGESQDMKG